MNRYYLYLLLLLGFLVFVPASAQNTGAPTAAVADTITVHDTIFNNQREFSPGFKEKYRGNEFQYEVKTQAKSGWDRFWEAIGNFFRRLFNFNGNGAKVSVWDIVIKILAFAVIGLAIYMIVRALLNKEGMWIFGKSRKDITMQDVTAEDLQHIDFEEMIKKAAAEGNYRLSIRYYYLWLLKRLAARDIIDWHPDKTNSDYLYEINNEALRKKFEYLSYVYDYSWYGEFPVDETAYNKAANAFANTINTL